MLGLLLEFIRVLVFIELLSRVGRVLVLSRLLTTFLIIVQIGSYTGPIVIIIVIIISHDIVAICIAV